MSRLTLFFMMLFAMTVLMKAKIEPNVTSGLLKKGRAIFQSVRENPKAKIEKAKMKGMLLDLFEGKKFKDNNCK